MKRFVSKGLLLFAGLAALPATLSKAERVCQALDPRLESLRKFFEKSQAPAHLYSEQFLWIADQYDLDWRLLPSISFVETGGGREARNNNLFGWKNGQADFPTVTAGIRMVAQTLAYSKLYQGKNLDTKLAIYNGYSHYAGVVRTVMKQIHPTEQVRTYHTAAPFIRASVH